MGSKRLANKIPMKHRIPSPKVYIAGGSARSLIFGFVKSFSSKSGLSLNTKLRWDSKLFLPKLVNSLVIYKAFP